MNQCLNTIVKTAAKAMRSATSKPRQRKVIKKNKSMTSRQAPGRTRLQASQRQRVVTQHGKDSTVISGSEIVNSIPFTLETTPGVTVFSVIPVNPAYWLGTNIAQQAAQYSAYRPLSFSYTYIPSVGVTHNGIVQVGTLWASQVGTSALSQTLQTSPGGCMSQVYSRFSRRVPLRGLQQKNFNTNGALQQDTNPFFLVAYNRGGVTIQNDSIDGQPPIGETLIPGTLIIHYRYLLINKIGASWTYGRENNITPDDVDLSKANISFVVRSGPLPPLTVLDVDNGEYKYNGTKIDPSRLVGDYYWNTPSDNFLGNSSLLQGGDITIQKFVGAEYSNDYENWSEVTWYGPVAYLSSYGGPKMVTLFACFNAGSTEHTKGYTTFCTWYGLRSVDKTLQQLVNEGYIAYIPWSGVTNLWIRAKSSMGKHSTPILYQPSWTNAISLTTQPPDFVINPPWGTFDLSPLNPGEPPSDLPEDYPPLDPDSVNILEKVINTDVEGVAFMPQTESILNGTYVACAFFGTMPFVARKFTLNQATLYQPTSFPSWYWITGDSQFKELIPDDQPVAVFGEWPYAIYGSVYGIPTQFKLERYPPADSSQSLVNYHFVFNSGVLSLQRNSSAGIYLQLPASPTSDFSVTVIGRYNNAAFKFCKIVVIEDEYVVEAPNTKALGVFGDEVNYFRVSQGHLPAPVYPTLI